MVNMNIFKSGVSSDVIGTAQEFTSVTITSLNSRIFRKIKVDVPNASNTQEEKNEDNNPISIIISSENKFYISDEEVDELSSEDFDSVVPFNKSSVLTFFGIL